MRLGHRRLIGAAVALVVFAAVGIPASAGAKSSPIKHVVVLYLENHSFDNVFGYWCDHNRRRCPDGGMPPSVTLADGTVVTPTVAPDTVPNASHDVEAQTAAVDGGKMDGWAKVFGCQASRKYACISGYKPSQIPNIITLAKDFAISDNTFSMANSPSWAGHLYAALASLDGFLGDLPVAASGDRPRARMGLQLKQGRAVGPQSGCGQRVGAELCPRPLVGPRSVPVRRGVRVKPGEVRTVDLRPTGRGRAVLADIRRKQERDVGRMGDLPFAG